ncbi:MAG: hypothetical protein ACR9NN_01410 [Nostochopsis sp.]
MGRMKAIALQKFSNIRRSHCGKNERFSKETLRDGAKHPPWGDRTLAFIN